MDAIRSFVQTLLPFEFMQFDFMVNALLAILLLTPLLGLLARWRSTSRWRSSPMRWATAR